MTEQRKESRLILQSGMYIFCVTNFFSVLRKNDYVKLGRFNSKLKDSVQTIITGKNKQEKANVESIWKQKLLKPLYKKIEM